jgi:hypothetical protein
LALTLWPISCKAAASLSWLFETHNRGAWDRPSDGLDDALQLIRPLMAERPPGAANKAQPRGVLEVRAEPLDEQPNPSP